MHQEAFHSMTLFVALIPMMASNKTISPQKIQHVRSPSGFLYTGLHFIQNDNETLNFYLVCKDLEH